MILLIIVGSAYKLNSGPFGHITWQPTFETEKIHLNTRNRSDPPLSETLS